MGDIAQAVGLNKANIYYYFKNKLEILIEVSTQPVRRLIESAKEIMATDAPPGNKLEALVRAHLNPLLSDRSLVGTGFEERRHMSPRTYREYVALRDEYEAFYRKIIGELVHKKVFRPVDPKIASLFTLGLMNSVGQWYRPGGKLSFDELVQEAYAYIYGALKA